ncbi:MAG: SDR family oxidoreductase [Luteibacter sp.]|uniref:SDR family oxidoreductase n=1 Tax=Rhodanobacteraceae TaxID=1775411 RepID=UPI00087E9856|nr:MULTISPECIES: SDR family oxidoreductase [Rhodanobacteraceae]MDQ7994246.1 SDR family oxidoreductase [Luteibacter sp.]MDQ8048547.1 SDR family oxidoreductase [Luteibacter sp.]SDG16904.1 Nucleoside-diphosphate-sugar epimerase [Dyella sp. 333MFSha]
MRIFLTGATGFIGSRIVPELIAAGHHVLGMTRSDSGARALQAAGADVHRGELEDLESLRAGAAQADAVIHTAFDHNFANFVANCEKDQRAIRALGSALIGSDRPLLITSGTGIGSPGHGELAREDVFNAAHPNPRTLTEITGNELLDKGVAVSVVRLPQVHDPVKQGLITPLLDIIRAKGVSAYVGDGQNRWPAAHVLDVARLYRLAIEQCKPGTRYNAVAEEGITARAIAEALGEGLGIPVKSIDASESAAYFGWMSAFMSMDLSASSAWTRQALGWNPTGPTLLEDLRRMDYSVAA